MRALAFLLLALAGCDYARIEVAASDAADDDAPAADAASPDDAATDAATIDGAATDASATDAPTDAAVDAAACVENTRRCVGNNVEQCTSGSWTQTQACTNLCSQGGCVTPASCSGGVATCGTSGNDTCCRSLPVAGGMFSRSYDGVSSGYTDNRYMATLSGFHLDKYEVSVARFNAFVAAYPGSKPADGTGRNPNDASDTGWRSTWTPLLPTTQAALVAALDCEGLTSQTTTHPVRCVSWYVAQAFCIWDGGRLPTEAEWNYAASGGSMQRVYPWSMPATSTSISSANAVYGTAGPARPGSLSPAGDGFFGQSDLAGNVWEWVFDNYADPYPTQTCVDCANHTAASYRGNRGGAYTLTAPLLITSMRGALDPAMTRAAIGFRCARNPLP